MKRKWLVIPAIFLGAIVAFAGVVAITGYQCCHSAVKPASFNGADKAPSHNEVATAAALDDIGIYSVPLRCGLVHGLGCGSASKPVMMKLDRHPAVAGSWLNYSGTTLAVLWKEDANGEKRSEAVASAFQEYPPPSELSGKDREVAMSDFLSGVGWYRTAALDELSKQEADIVATRWVGKITSIIPMPKKVREALQCKLAERMRSRFVEE